MLVANSGWNHQNSSVTVPNRKIRWGVLGYARIARQSVIPAILRAANSEFLAIASRDDSKLAECRAAFNARKTYRAYEELLRDPEVDAVYIPLPNSLHREWTIKAAEHGKHVLCEKPIALNTAECRDMIAACAANQVTLMEAFMYRYTTRTRKVLEVLRSGVLGEIRFISSTFRFLLANPASIKFKPELGGGALYDVGCYPVNFAGMVTDEIARSQSGNPAVLGAMPESISVECVHSGGVDLIFSALVRYPSGLIASLNCGLNAQKRIASEIVGTQGALEIPDTFFDNAGELMLTVSDERKTIRVEESDRYRLEVEDFADAILRERAPHFSLAETQRNMKLLDRLITASRSF
jgi:xylose dehydrogenase (NAD/NADP)